ncbi:MAG: hypothetical protein ABSA52_21290 [Candidatus Binatia bacterium]|jgi:hypothetical protein
MSSIHLRRSAGPQLKLGAAILAAARTADTRLIKDRLAAFEQAQRRYADSHGKVQQLETDLGKAQAQFRTDQQAVVDALARALVADGQPLRNPFGAFGAASMGVLMHMPPTDAAKALPELIAGMRRSKMLGKQTLQAVQGAEKVTRGLEQAVTRLETLGTAVRDARSSRDAVAPAWDAALGALKRGARAAADDGATTLYATLFSRPARANGKNHKPAPPAAPTPSPAVSPTPQPEPAVS